MVNQQRCLLFFYPCIERCVLFDFAVLPAKPYYFDRQFSFPILDRLLKKQLNVRNFSKFCLVLC